MAHIEIDPDALDAMRAHALREYPHECCGALFGSGTGATDALSSDERRVVAVMPIDNVTDEDRRRRFSVSPRDYIRAEREALRLGLDLLGFYHSHPDHPAAPSATDRRFAQPGFSYPIISVTRDRILAVTSWRVRDADAWYEEEEVRSRSESGVGREESGVGRGESGVGRGESGVMSQVPSIANVPDSHPEPKARDLDDTGQSHLYG